MMSLTRKSRDCIADGVELFGKSKKYGPFFQYRGFAVPVSSEKSLEFHIDRIYRVKTLGSIGYARLNMIFQNEKTAKCFAKFALYHLPEDTKIGKLPWKHGEDELLAYAHDITIRCSSVLAWTTPEKTHVTSGTMQFVSNEMEEHRSKKHSLIRNQNPSTQTIGQYSVFAGNAKLSKELGFDVTTAKYAPVAPLGPQMAPNECSTEGLEHQLKGTSKTNAYHLVVEKTEPSGIPKKVGKVNGRKYVPQQSSSINNGGILGIVKVPTPTSNENKNNQSPSRMPHNLPAQISAVLNRPARSCNSMYGPNRKRAFERSDEQVPIIEARAPKRQKSEPSAPTKDILTSINVTKPEIETSASRKRKRTSENEQAHETYDCDGERECKMRIMNYDNYVKFRNCRMGLNAGLVVKKEVALEIGVLAAEANKCSKVFFTRTFFSEKDIERTLLFEKQADRKCPFGKKRKVQKPLNSNIERSISMTRCVEDFKEDGWKIESEKMYFESVGYHTAKDSRYTRYKKPSITSETLEINDLPAWEFENDTKGDAAEDLIRAFVEGY